MRAFQAAALTLLWITGALSTACAQTQETTPPPPPEPPSHFGQEPPPPPRPPPPPDSGRDSDERRERIRRLEARIHELEAGLARKDASDEQRKEWSVQLDHSRAELKELLVDRPRPDEARKDLHDKMRRVEAEIHELERAIEGKDAAPEQREKWKQQLNFARSELMALRAKLEGQGKGPFDPDPRSQDRMANRLREIDELLKKGVGPEDQKELNAEKKKLQDELARRNPHPFGDPMIRSGQPPPDPEAMKLQRQAMELERQSFDLSAKLRSLPKDNKDERAELTAKLKETVVQLFDLREKARAREVDMIKKRLEELTQLLEKRKANRDAIIEKRLKQLTGESDDLDW